MSSFLTHCPHCQTSFRITDRQVEAARGTVRCGACLGLFSAPANRITVRQPLTEEQLAALQMPPEVLDDEELHAAPTATAAITPGYESVEEPGEDEEELTATADTEAFAAQAPFGAADADDIEDERMQAAAPPAVAAPISGMRNYDIPLGDLDMDDIFADAGYDAGPDMEDPDKSGELNGFDAEDEFDTEAEAEAEDTDEYEEDPAEEDSAVDDEEEYEEEYDEEEYEEEYDDEDDEELFEDDEQEAFAADADQDQPGFTASAAPPFRQPSSLSAEKQAYQDYLATLQDDDALEPLAPASFATLESEPLLLSSRPRRRRLTFVALCGLNLLLAAVFVLQYVDTNLERLSRTPVFAPALPYLCRILECPLPQRANITSLRSQELLVRSHPRLEQTLEVSIVFSNEADLPQPFPALELGFADINNRVLSNRLFNPPEYLPEQLRAIGEMPPHSSVQVLLELVDPGAAAVNYTLAFREP